MALTRETKAELLASYQGDMAAYSDDDPVGLAKTLTEFAHDVPVLEFKGGLVDGQQVSAEAIREIASLPSREALVAKLLFLLQSPIARLVRGLGDITPRFLRALNQVADQKDGD